MSAYYNEFDKHELLELGIQVIGDINGPYKIVVPLSGGKDSQCCLKLARREYNENEVLALFCDTGYEHPLTYDHVSLTADNYGVDLVTLKAGTVWDVCKKYGRFPGGGARHCTDELKVRPSKFFYRELAKNHGGFEVWYGVRSDESKEREKRYEGKVSTDLYAPHEFMPSKYPKYLANMGVMFRLPVLDWGKQEIFDLLGGEENPLYRNGFDRVGCFPCLASGDSHKMKAFCFDETGAKHFQIAQEIEQFAGYPVLNSKKYAGQGPGCALCAM